MWRFSKEYVIIQIEGVYPERLTSLLQGEGVPLRDVYRPQPGTLVCTLPARDFHRLHRLNRRCRCQIRIRKKGGGRYSLRPLWRRRVLVLGMFFTLLIIWWASRRVWFLDVRDCQPMDAEVLRMALYEQGLRPGRKLSNLPLSAIGDYVAAQYEEIAFLELHVDGIFLRVRTKGALAQGEKLDLSVPCDLVSAKTGVVTGLTAYGGRAQVKVGDRVQKGQLLIAGRVTARDGSMSYQTHAYGEVLAAVLYTSAVPAPKTTVEWAVTGKVAPYAALVWKGKTLWARRCPFADGEWTVETTVSLSPWPLSVCRGTWREKVKQERPLSEAERKEAALFEAERMALLQVPRQAKIIMIDRHTERKQGELYGVCTVTAEENIGRTKEIE